jgi:butyrate kinase
VKTLHLKSMPAEDLFQRLLGSSLMKRLDKEGYRILVVNPGSTSTKVAYFVGLEKRYDFETHIDPDLDDTAERRAGMILSWMADRDIDLAGLHGIAARGGVFAPVPGGIYRLSDALVDDLNRARLKHASNMGVPIAMALKDLASFSNQDIPITITDPVVIDEVEIESRMTGLGRFKTDGTAVHYLNHRAVMRISAWEFGIDPNDASVISAHLGGGISIARYHRGKAVRVLNAFSGVPSANRCGALPIHDVIHALQDQNFSIDELSRGVFREGGLLSLTGTDDFKTLLNFRDHGATEQQSAKINLVLRFMAQKIGEGIMSMAAGWGRPDYICITGGLARSDELSDRIEGRIGGLLPIVRVPGSAEAEALAAGMAKALMEPDCVRKYEEERDMLHTFRRHENRLIDQPVFKRQVRRRRKGSPIRSLDELIQATRNQVHDYFKPTIAIAGSDSEAALEAARRATEDGEYKIARFLLVGDKVETLRVAKEIGLDFSGDDFEIEDSRDPVARCLELYAQGRCQVLMKGSVSTGEILGPIFKWLKQEGRLPEKALFSHVAVFQRSAQSKLLLLTDAGINVNPDVEQRKRILENALYVARGLNLPRPRVAVISALEKVSRNIPSSVEAAEIASFFSERADCLVEGPLSYDVALDPDVAREKNYRGEIQGSADILVMNDIDAANPVYKTLSVSTGLNAAGAIVGCGVPVVLTSRTDGVLTKLASIALCLRMLFLRHREALAAGENEQ